LTWIKTVAMGDAACGIYPSIAGVVKPYGQWNTTRIVVQGSHAAVSYELGSADWRALALRNIRIRELR